MELEKIAQCLAELGHSKRLQAYQLLVRAGDEGLTVGEIQRHLDMPKSTFSHHIDRLSRVDLISQEREGRIIRCRANFGAMRNIVDFLSKECCSGIFT
ncbi:ArsR/SmtB family transcription factor [Paremcibacter congregatus]|uniref:Transcriptional regulator n=1 Tax=Paremcibacter congregatus TaxID=2043170 RepID=A0A2G4YTT8_9PROT|nr:metalloregulator ArsR/SmtB family transcription factor [Paremcibacter congregatus]PHZ85738.1 transcriptional regulator [Paremcibacter congregatus]QDE26702.1 helix-turn-helix transcriptional regulator [Paremcibacter congregatus]|tara:strand:+ start:9837 stop:10130 length:294 start_codon:yes stop_codon:yes gene_type:complete